MGLRHLAAAALLCFFLSSMAFAEAPDRPGTQDRCPVCGMFVSPFPNWISLVQFQDGSAVYFDGPKDMFTYLENLPKYRADSSSGEASGVFATEYYSTRLMKAADLLFISGSDVLGPMGNELVPVAGQEQAETFKRDHGGNKILRFDGKNLVEFLPNQ